MKITGTRVIEQKIIKMFNDSRDQFNKERYIEAQIMIKKIIDVFKLISVFENFNHTDIVKKLYFTKNNIVALGVKKMSDLFYMDEKTLYKLRNKYCLVISEVLNQ